MRAWVLSHSNRLQVVTMLTIIEHETITTAARSWRCFSVVRAVQLAATQRLGVLMLTGARHFAASAHLRAPCAADAVVVAKDAATAERRSVGIARAAPHRHWPLPCFFMPAQRTPVYLSGW